MRHRSENLSRTIAITIICIVATILALSFVGYVGERIVSLKQTIATPNKGV